MAPHDEEEGISNEELFSRAMSDVEPLQKRNLRIAGPAPSDSRGVDKTSAPWEESPRLLELRDDGVRLEALAPGVDQRVVRKLRSGHDPRPEVTFDLHGLRRPEAIAHLGLSLGSARERGVRTVLVVTGRGRGSEGGVPILRHAVIESLLRRGDVLAFTEAAPPHGGRGAFYVLLRRAPS